MLNHSHSITRTDHLQYSLCCFNCQTPALRQFKHQIWQHPGLHTQSCGNNKSQIVVGHQGFHAFHLTAQLNGILLTIAQGIIGQVLCPLSCYHRYDLDSALGDPFSGCHTIGIPSPQYGDLFLHAWGDRNTAPRQQMINHYLPLALEFAGRDQRTGIEDIGQHRHFLG